MITVTVEWQRLVDEKGETCDRCNKTYVNLERVISLAMPFLENFGIRIEFLKKAISMEDFQKNPLLSNQIIIDGKPIEQMLSLQVGQSTCCGPCGDNECRTIIDGNVEKEDVEERLILKAILKTLVEKL